MTHLKILWLWLICFKLLCWPAVNVSVTFAYALLLFLCSFYSFILISIWLFNTPFIIPGEEFVCFSVSCQYAYSLVARFTDAGPSGPNSWWRFEVWAHGPSSSAYPGLGCDPVGSASVSCPRSSSKLVRKGWTKTQVITICTFCLCVLSPYMFQPAWAIFSGRNISA
jgi:hypothetical protein